MAVSVLVPVRDRTAHLRTWSTAWAAPRRRRRSSCWSAGWAATDPRPALATGARLRGAALSDRGRGAAAGARPQRARGARRGARSLVFLDVDCVPVAGRCSPPTRRRWTSTTRWRSARPATCPAGSAPTAGRRERCCGGRRRPHPERGGLFPAPGAIAVDDRHELFWSLNFAVRRDTFLARIGGFDEDYRGYGIEDTDFADARGAGGGAARLGRRRARLPPAPPADAAATGGGPGAGRERAPLPRALGRVAGQGLAGRARRARAWSTGTRTPGRWRRGRARAGSRRRGRRPRRRPSGRAPAAARAPPRAAAASAPRCAAARVEDDRGAVPLQVLPPRDLLAERPRLRHADQAAAGEGRLGDGVGAAGGDDDGAAGEQVEVDRARAEHLPAGRRGGDLRGQRGRTRRARAPAAGAPGRRAAAAAPSKRVIAPT